MQTIFLRLVSPQEYLAEVGEGQRVGRGHPPGGELQQGPAGGAVQAAGRRHGQDGAGGGQSLVWAGRAGHLEREYLLERILAG